MNGFGADEVFFQIGVDGAGGFLGAGVGGHGPGTALVFADGEETDEAEQLVAAADEADEAAFFEPVGAEEFGSFFVVHFGELGFDFAAEGGEAGVGVGGQLGEIGFGAGRFKVG